MKALDFEYDGLLLSDFGFMICNFDDNSFDTVSNGSQISFNTTPILRGNKVLLTDTSYKDCLETTFSICKNPCKTSSHDLEPISQDEIRQIMRWLNRKDFHKFKIIEEGYENVFFEGSFNINKTMLNGEVIAFELNLTTNRPFALQEPVRFSFDIGANQEKVLSDKSDEIGFIYVEAEIVCKASGDLIVTNDIENRKTIIKNCTSGEILKLNSPIIETSISSHKVQNDFNYNFLRLANTLYERRNRLTFSLPCSVKITYTPIRKVGI